jgi:FkbM family methyltransferase
MSNVNKMRKLAVSLVPPIFYPLILRVVNSNLIYGVLKGSGKNFYNPSWHTIPNGKLKGVKLFIDSSSGEWEMTMTTGTYDEYFINYLSRLPLKGKVFFDIGAHIGYSSLTFSALAKGKGRCIAFEPNTFNRERLETHVQQNSEIGQAIHVYPYAVSDKDGKQDFVFTNNVDGWTSSGSFLSTAHTRLENTVYEREYGFTRTKVSVIRLDAFVKKEKIIPDIIKIDIEGAEHLALAGGRQTLSKYKPILLIELHSIFATAQVYAILNELGYKTEILHEDNDGRVFIAATAKKGGRK